MVTIEVRTSRPVEAVDITHDVERAVRESGVAEGLCVIHVPHTTAGVIVNENDDPDVMRDLLAHLTTLVPKNGGFRHAEGNADAHIKSTVIGCSTTLLVSGARPVLGRWQGVFFCEFDGPRTRRAHVAVVGA